jgi:hypothetical protein
VITVEFRDFRDTAGSSLASRSDKSAMAASTARPGLPSAAFCTASTVISCPVANQPITGSIQPPSRHSLPSSPRTPASKPTRWTIRYQRRNTWQYRKLRKQNT